MKLELFYIVNVPLVLMLVGGKQVVNSQIQGNLCRLLTIPQSSPKTLMVSRNLVVKLIT